MGAKLAKIKEWFLTQIKTKSWKRHVALLVILIPMLLQKFGVSQEAIGWINQLTGILTGGVTDDGTIATTLTGAIFYGYGWIKRKKNNA